MHYYKLIYLATHEVIKILSTITGCKTVRPLEQLWLRTIKKAVSKNAEYLLSSKKHQQNKKPRLRRDHDLSKIRWAKIVFQKYKKNILERKARLRSKRTRFKWNGVWSRIQPSVKEGPWQLSLTAGTCLQAPASLNRLTCQPAF